MATGYHERVARYLSEMRQAELFWRVVGLLRSVWSWQPLTTRGVLSLLVGCWALIELAIPESDLIAYTVGGAAVGIAIISTFIALIIRIRVAKRITIQPIFRQGENLVGEAVPAGIILQNISLPPFFTLRAERVFQHPGSHSPVHVIAGSDARSQIVDAVSFSHRGFWSLGGIKFSLQDAFGLSHLCWLQECSGSVEVSARIVPIRPLPIVAASSRSGDQLNISQERAGDLFDIKAYDPSDGITRVLWKTFARSGQLVVRRPEPAVIPEGEVAIYVIAGATDDVVVGAFLSYLDELERGNLTVLFGTDGLRDASTGNTTESQDFMTDYTVIRHSLNRTVWHRDTGTGRGLAHYLDALDSQKRPISRLVLFGSEATDLWLQSASLQCAARHIALTAVIVPARIDPYRDLLANGHSTKLFQRLRNGQRRDQKMPHITTATSATSTDVLVCERNDILV